MESEGIVTVHQTSCEEQLQTGTVAQGSLGLETFEDVQGLLVTTLVDVQVALGKVDAPGRF